MCYLKRPRRRSTVATARAESRCVESSGSAHTQTLDTVIAMARCIDMFPILAPHICLVQAQFGHLFGKEHSAASHYRTAQVLLRESTEMGLVVEICSISASARLIHLHRDPTLLQEVTVLADTCRASSNANIAACGYFLGSLIEQNRIGSK